MANKLHDIFGPLKYIGTVSELPPNATTGTVAIKDGHMYTYIPLSEWQEIYPVELFNIDYIQNKTLYINT